MQVSYSKAKGIMESRDETMSCSAISYPYFGWLDESRRNNESDDWIKQKMKNIADSEVINATNSKSVHYHIDNGLLKYKSWIVIGPRLPWKFKLMEKHHSTLTAGH